MKIVNFETFLEFAGDMATRYKFYRITENKIQCFMVGRDGIIIYSDLEKATAKNILDIVGRGFIETRLSKEEIELMGLE